MQHRGRRRPWKLHATLVRAVWYALQPWKVPVHFLRSQPAWRALVLLPILTFACGSSTEPVPAGPQVSGRVEIVSTLTEVSGIETGQRTITNATGVPVQLVRADAVVAEVLSVDGQFRFFGVAAGDYVVRLPQPGLGAFTQPVTVAAVSVNLALPLRIEPSTLLLTAPNPCTRAEGLAIYRDVPVAGRVQADVLNLAFESVSPPFSLPSHPATLFHYHWFPDPGSPAGLYWVRVRIGGIDTVELVELAS